MKLKPHVLLVPLITYLVDTLKWAVANVAYLYARPTFRMRKFMNVIYFPKPKNDIIYTFGEVSYNLR